MKVEKDFEDFLRLLRKNKVRYCIIGAYAVSLYGKPRYTKDIDIYIDPNIKNANRLVKSINEFGMESLNLTAKDFSKKGNIIQLGYEPVRIDIHTAIKGCSFEKVWKNKKMVNYGEEKTCFIGLDDLIKNKKATNRKQDRIDLEVLSKD